MNSLFRLIHRGLLLVEAGTQRVGVEPVVSVRLLRRPHVHETDDGVVGVQPVDLLDAAEAEACRR